MAPKMSIRKIKRWREQVEEQGDGEWTAPGDVNVIEALDFLLDKLEQVKGIIAK